MENNEIKKVGIIGQGTMGSQIAQSILMAGFNTKIFDVNTDLMNNSHSKMLKNIKKSVKRNVIASEKGEKLQENLIACSDLKDLSDRDLIIEAVFEDKDIKYEIFTKLEEVADENCIFASNTSSLSITGIAKCLKNRERFIGLHFFYPAYYNKLVEVIKGFNTSDNVIQRSMTFIKAINKEPVLAKDTPGFIVNRILVPMIGEAIRLLELNVATPEDIDNAMVMATSLPQGPLKLADMVGLDIILNVQEIFYQEYGEPSYKPSILLKRMVDAGYHGVKTNKGFYTY